MSIITSIPGGTTQTILDSLVKYGITNPYLQAGILGVIYKETNFVPKGEYSYRNTSAKRLKQIFSFLKNMSDADVDALKKDDVKFYEKIYGGKYGNDSYGDGWKYRGRGLNGITFKDYYKVLTKNLGIDLVNFPDRLNELPIASDALAYYFADGLRSGKKSGLMKQKFGFDSPDDVKDLNTGTQLAVQMNAGWKTAFTHPTIQEGYKRALSVVPDFYAYLNLSPYVAPVIETALAPADELVDIATNPKRKKARRIVGAIAGVGILTTLGIIYHQTHKA